jgi:hypothetical protein
MRIDVGAAVELVLRDTILVASDGLMDWSKWRVSECEMCEMASRVSPTIGYLFCIAI